MGRQCRQMGKRYRIDGRSHGWVVRLLVTFAGLRDPALDEAGWHAGPIASLQGGEGEHTGNTCVPATDTPPLREVVCYRAVGGANGTAYPVTPTPGRPTMSTERQRAGDAGRQGGTEGGSGNSTGGALPGRGIDTESGGGNSTDGTLRDCAPEQLRCVGAQNLML